MAAALKADRCEIYSDVDGVYTTDPNLIKDAKHLPEISYEQIQEMGEAGAKVLNAQAVQFAKKAKIAIYARSTFDSARETIVREMAPTGKQEIIGVVQETDITRIIFKKKDIHNHLDELFTFLEIKNIPVKELNYIQDKFLDLEKVSFVISKKNVHNWLEVEKELIIKYKSEIFIDETLGAVSLIGEGFSRDNGLITETIRILNKNRIIFFGLTTTSFRLSLLIKKEILDSAVEVLHNYWIK
jgi:aspartate kinase